MIRIIIAAAVLCTLATVAEARPRHVATTGLDPMCNIIMPCILPSVSTPQARRETRGRYVARQMGELGSPRLTHAAPVRASARVARAQDFAANYYDISPFGQNGAISRPARYIGGRLVCALNVGAALAERGIRGTGSALAKSYDHWGHRSAPVPGAVAVSDRRGGGHVAIVSRVEGGRVFVWNATGGHRGWSEREYTNRHARYRVAG